MTLISLIVPCYQNERDIGDCLASIKKQDLADVEIVFVHDASPDTSGRIVRTWIESQRRANTAAKLVFVDNETNLGRGGARAAGVKASSGRFIAFLDGDDCLAPGYFSTLKNTIQRVPSFDILSFNYYTLKEFDNGSEISLEPAEMSRAPCNVMLDVNIAKDLHAIDRHLAHGRYFLWLLVVRRELLEKVPLSSARHYEDIDTVPSLFLAAQRVYFLEDYLICYRDSVTGLVNNPTLEHVRSLDSIARSFSRRCDESAHWKTARRFYLVIFRIVHHLFYMENILLGYGEACRRMHFRVFGLTTLSNTVAGMRYATRLSPLREVVSYVIPELKLLSRRKR